MDELCKVSQDLVFGPEFAEQNRTRIATIQALSGTGALRLGGEFLREFVKGKPIYLSNPTWGMRNGN